MWSLHNLKPAPGSRKPKRIVGRGEGSTLGQTAGKGQKGQRVRSGESFMSGFEGGQTPLMRRLPKRGFRHPSKVYYQPINLGTLEKSFSAGAEITTESLLNAGLIKNTDVRYKILGSGALTKSFKVSTYKISKSAQEAIVKAGGSVTLQKG